MFALLFALAVGAWYPYAASLPSAVVPADTLHVLRVTPDSVVSRRDSVVITFDRPMVGSLDAPASVSDFLELSPAVAGTLSWRDPVSLVFVPAGPWPRDTEYRLTVRAGVTAMGGEVLVAPSTHRLRTAPPLVYAVALPDERRWLDPQVSIAGYQDSIPAFVALADGEILAERVEERARVVAGYPRTPRCVEVEPVAVRTSARSLRDDDPRSFEWQARRIVGQGLTLDSLQVLEIVPVRALPESCVWSLVVPRRVGEVPDTVRTDRAGAYPFLHFSFTTRGPPDAHIDRCHASGVCDLSFSRPVTGEEMVEAVSGVPALPQGWTDGIDRKRVSGGWSIPTGLPPQRSVVFRISPTLTDVFGDTLGREITLSATIPSFPKAVSWYSGRVMAYREGGRFVVPMSYMNVDAWSVWRAPVPDSLELALLRDRTAWWESHLSHEWNLRFEALTTEVDSARDTLRWVDLPVSGEGGREAALTAMRVRGRGVPHFEDSTVAVVQSTDLAVFARSGMDQAVIRVIGVRDGLPREGAEVTVYDVGGGMRAKGATDASGMARFDSLSWPTPCADCVDGWRADSFDGHVEVRSGRDRALAILGEAVPESGRIYRWGSRGGDRAPATVRVIADRPRYRPGETIHAKVVARVGTSGALGVPRGDSIRWKFYDAKGALLEDQVHALSDFGTAARSFRIDPDAPLGSYRSEIQLFRAGSWRTMTRQGVDVEEYRTPEFLVSLVASDSAVTVGDSVTVTAQGRYLFEAPMVGADVEWRISAIPVFEVARLIPGMQGWVVGDANRMESDPEVTADTLDGRGEAFIRFRAEPRGMPLPYRSIVQATVTDANRQTMTDRVDVVVHPASWYVGVREPEEAGPWVAERPVSVDVVVVDQQGRRVPDVRVRGVLVLTDSPARGEVADTVANCSVTTAVEPVSCTFVPPGRGTYELVLEVTDPDGRSSITILRRWVGTRMGFPGFGGPGEEETWVSVDRGSYTVGDTAVLTVTSPFGEGDAWVAVMQERILESRVLRVGGDTVQIRIPVDEGMIPMAQVSVVFSRPVDSRFRVLPDSVNVRQVAAWIMVDPSPKWLEVRVTPEEPEYQPGDSARFSVSVRDQGGAGVPAEVMLWAVDEGEMAATSWELPDPVSLMYERKNGAIVASSNLTVVGAETRRWANRGRVALASSVQGVSLDEIVVTGAAAVGVGQSPTAVIVRHDFRSTAFFLASIVTDEEGNAAAAAKLPDNLTTFRVMAVAVSREDRFGSGESKIVVDLPLMARLALPRFVRPSDRFRAGVVVNSKLADTVLVQVTMEASGIEASNAGPRELEVESNRGYDVRFGFRAQRGDSARFEFQLRGGGEADAVRTVLPVEPTATRLVRTYTGVLHDEDRFSPAIEDDLDLGDSSLEIDFGSSPLAFISAVGRILRAYPYHCSEQVASATLPLVAMHRAGLAGASRLDDPASREREIDRAIRILARRQGEDGGIGYWTQGRMESVFVTAHVARMFMEARSAEVEIPEDVLGRMGDYLTAYLAGYAERGDRLVENPDLVLRMLDRMAYRYRWSERVAAVDALSRMGRGDAAAEDALLRDVANLFWTDRLILAQALGRSGRSDEARRLVTETLAEVAVEGRTLLLPEHMRTSRYSYFNSSTAPTAVLVETLILLDPGHPALGPGVEGLVQRSRAGSRHMWNTYDYAWVTLALARYAEHTGAQPSRVVRLETPGTTVELAARAGESQAVLPLSRALPDGGDELPLRLAAEGDGPPLFYFTTLSMMPSGEYPNPVDQGIAVERWYEDYATGAPVVDATEGDLIRVRLRVTVPEDRYFVVVDDPLPAGLEAVDVGTPASPLMGSGSFRFWSVWDHREMRDERVIFSSTHLWRGTHTMTYVVRATTEGTFFYPPAHAEEMYNPGLNGRTGGGRFVVKPKG